MLKSGPKYNFDFSASSVRALSKNHKINVLMELNVWLLKNLLGPVHVQSAIVYLLSLSLCAELH